MAKPKKSPKSAPKSTMAGRRKKRRQRVVTTTMSRTVREVRPNPPVMADLTHVLLPGFAAYAGTRILARIVYSLVQRKFPQFGKHAHALAGAAAFGGSWFFAHKIKPIAPYHDSILMGSGVAALEGIAKAYLPDKYNWLLRDCKPSDVAPATPPPATGPTDPALDPGATGDDEYSYLEQQLAEFGGAGSAARTVRPPRATQRPVANAMAMATKGQNNQNVALDPDLTEELGNEDVDDLYSGAFANGN